MALKKKDQDMLKTSELPGYTWPTEREKGNAECVGFVRKTE